METNMTPVPEFHLQRGLITLIDPTDSIRVCRLELNNGFVLESRPVDFHWYARKAGHFFYATAQRKIGEKVLYVQLHRLITGAKPIEMVDHKNRNGLDNRSDNLRLCSRTFNLGNQWVKAERSLPKGVSWVATRSKFQAVIGIHKKKFHLGYFDSADAAGRAYDAKARELYGEFARLNYPDSAA